MKSWTTSLLLVASLCASVALAADEITAPISFETEAEKSVSTTINTEGAAWWSTSGNEGLSVGEAKEYTTAELNEPSLSPSKRSAAFTDGNTIKFVVNAGDEIVFRSVLPLVSENDKIVMQGYALTNGAIYADALVKFVPSTAPYTTGNDEDKIIVWMDAEGYICIEAGYFEKSLGKSGLVPKTYKTTKQILDGSWHRIVFEVSIPLEMQTYNAACRIWIDGEVLTIAGGGKIVNDDLKTQFESYLTDEAKNAYLLGTLFPARASKPATELFRGLGFSGSDGEIDDIVYQNTEPNIIPADPGSRYFTIAVDPGIESLEYSVDGGAAFPVLLGGKRADIAIKIPTKHGSGDQTEVTIDNVALSADYGSWDISLPTEEGGTSSGATSKTFSINAGVELVSGAIYTGEDLGYSVCKVSCGSISPAKTCTTLKAALELIAAAEDKSGALIRLTRNVNENIVINGIDVTLDLAGRTMVCERYDGATAITVANGNLNLIDSASTGAIEIEGGSDDWAIEVYGNTDASATIQAGSFKGRVVPSNPSLRNIVVSGGRFYANGNASGFEELENCIKDGYAKTWYSTEKCWRVRRAALTAARLSAISLASASIGLSASSANHLEDENSLPVINIINMQTAFGDETSSITCLVTVTDSEGAVMEASALSLSSLVLVSKDLSKWEKPSKITYANTDEFGVYEVEMTMPSAGEYFIKLTTGE